MIFSQECYIYILSLLKYEYFICFQYRFFLKYTYYHVILFLHFITLDIIEQFNIGPIYDYINDIIKLYIFLF